MISISVYPSLPSCSQGLEGSGFQGAEAFVADFYASLLLSFVFSVIQPEEAPASLQLAMAGQDFSVAGSFGIHLCVRAILVGMALAPSFSFESQLTP